MLVFAVLKACAFSMAFFLSEVTGDCIIVLNFKYGLKTLKSTKNCQEKRSVILKMIAKIEVVAL